MIHTATKSFCAAPAVKVMLVFVALRREFVPFCNQKHESGLGRCSALRCCERWVVTLVASSRLSESVKYSSKTLEMISHWQFLYVQTPLLNNNTCFWWQKGSYSVTDSSLSLLETLSKCCRAIRTTTNMSTVSGRHFDGRRITYLLVVPFNTFTSKKVLREIQNPLFVKTSGT